jgi:hypothetical protein
MSIVRKGQNSREEALRKYFARPQKESPVTWLSLISIGGLMAFYSLISMIPGDPSHPNEVMTERYASATIG